MEGDQVYRAPDAGTVKGQNGSRSGTGQVQRAPVLITQRRRPEQKGEKYHGQPEAGDSPVSSDGTYRGGTARTFRQGAAGDTAYRGGTARTSRRGAAGDTAYRGGTARTSRQGAAGDTVPRRETEPKRTSPRERGRRENAVSAPRREAEARAERQRQEQLRRRREAERRARQLRIRIAIFGCAAIAAAAIGIYSVLSRTAGTESQTAAELQTSAESVSGSSGAESATAQDASAQTAAEDMEPSAEESAANLEQFTSADDVIDLEASVEAGVTMSESEVERVSEMMKRASWPESLIALFQKNNEARQFVLDYQKRMSQPLEASVADEVVQGKIPLFLQWDERWGYETYGDDFLALTGCGPTCLAMVYAGLSGRTDQNPYTIASLADQQGYYVEGSGSSWEIMTRFADEIGLEAEEISFSEDRIYEELAEGHPVICAVGPGDFTDNGHFIVMTDVTSDGLIRICDPNSYLRTQKEWEIGELMDQTRNLWSFYYAGY